MQSPSTSQAHWTLGTSTLWDGVDLPWAVQVEPWTSLLIVWLALSVIVAIVHRKNHAAALVVGTMATVAALAAATSWTLLAAWGSVAVWATFFLRRERVDTWLLAGSTIAAMALAVTCEQIFHTSQWNEMARFIEGAYEWDPVYARLAWAGLLLAAAFTVNVQVGKPLPDTRWGLGNWWAVALMPSLVTVLVGRYFYLGSLVMHSLPDFLVGLSAFCWIGGLVYKQGWIDPLARGALLIAIGFSVGPYSMALATCVLGTSIFLRPLACEKTNSSFQRVGTYATALVAFGVLVWGLPWAYWAAAAAAALHSQWPWSTPRTHNPRPLSERQAPFMIPAWVRWDAVFWPRVWIAPIIFCRSARDGLIWAEGQTVTYAWIVTLVAGLCLALGLGGNFF